MARYRGQSASARLCEREDPAVDAIPVAVLAGADPYHHEGSIRSEGHLRHRLVVVGVLIEPDFRPIRGAVRMVGSSPDVPRAIRRPALLPDYDEVAGSIGGHLLQAAEPNLRVQSQARAPGCSIQFQQPHREVWNPGLLIELGPDDDISCFPESRSLSSILRSR